MKKLLISFVVLVCFIPQGWAQQATTETVDAVFRPIENEVFMTSYYTSEIRCLSGRFSSEANGMGFLVVTFDDSKGNLVQGIFISGKNMAKETMKIAKENLEILFLVDYAGRIFSLEGRQLNESTPLYVAYLTGGNNNVFAYLNREGYLALKHQIEKSEDNGLLSFPNKMDESNLFGNPGEQFRNYLELLLKLKGL